MSLRHPIPEIEISPTWYGPLDSRVSRVKAPVVVEFRRNANLQEAVNAITSNKHVLVNAAVGAGKSVRLPSVVAEKSGLLVIQVFPSEFLAADVSDYVKTLGEKIEHVGVTGSWPKSGVAAVSAATLVARWLKQGELVLPECIVMHDESHESDAFTFVLKSIWPSVKGLHTYVCTTATVGADGFRSVEAEGGLSTRTYDSNLSSENWDVLGVEGYPWQAATMRGNVLIYEDNKDVAGRLVESYNRAGVDAFRLHSRMKLQAFRTTMDHARNSPGIVVLVADSSFRSGFTMPVSTVVDTGKVARLTVVDGKPVRRYRDAYAMERYQAAGRGGRTSGAPAVAWAPTGRPPAVVCTLEEVEAEAVALIFRVFRKAPPIEVIDAEMTEGKLPRDVVGALVGPMPLATLLPEQMVEMEELIIKGSSSPNLRPGVVLEGVNSLDFIHPAVSADVSRARSREREEVRRRDSAQSSYSVESPGKGVEGDTFSNVFDRLLNFSDDSVSVDMEPGKYYYAAGLEHFDTVSPMFPEAHLSVYKFLGADSSQSLQFGLSSRDRGTAVSALVARHNMCSCEVNAIVSVVKDLGALADGRDPVAFRAWVHDFTSKVGSLQTEMRLLEEGTARLVSGFCGLKQAAPFSEEESMISSALLDGLRIVPRLRVAHDRDRDVVREQIRASLSSGDYGGTSSSGDGSSSVKGLDMGYAPMEYRGRGMRATKGLSSTQAKALCYITGAKKPASAANRLLRSTR